MSLPNWQRTIVDASGNVVSGAQIDVVVEATGLAASIFSNRAGTTALTNPFFTGVDGFAEFYVAPGEYRVTATGPSGAVTWRYEVLPGTAAVMANGSGGATLGTAAVATVTTTAQDSTAGRLTKVGDYGLGNNNRTILTTTAALDAINTTRFDPFFEAGSGPFPGFAVTIQTICYDANNRCQIATRVGTSSLQRIRSANASGVWQAWVDVWHSGNAPTDSAWTTISTFSNGWTGTVRYKKTLGMVTVTAALNGTSATAGAATTLPSGYRPSVEMWVSTGHPAGGESRAFVRTAGTLDIESRQASVFFTVTFPTI